MNFLDNIVLPQSLEHITLLHFLTIIILMIFIPFLSVVMGGSVLSIFYRWKGRAEGNADYLKFSNEIIEITTINKSAAIGLGIAPIIMIILTYTQLLHSLSMLPVKYFILSFILILTGLILLFTFRYSSLFNSLFSKYMINENSKDHALEEISERVSRLYESSGKWGVFFILAGSFFFTGGMTAALFMEDPAMFDSFWSIFTSLLVISRWLYLLCTAMSLTGALLLFSYFYWEGGRDIQPDYAAVVRKISLKVIFIFSLIQPLFIFTNVAGLPAIALSQAVFGLVFFSIILLFVSFHLLYSMIKENSGRHTGVVFILLLLAMFAVLSAEHFAFSNAGAKHSLTLAAKYTETVSALEKQGAGPGSISGAEIFKTKCSACHSFTNKVVGPPYKETLPKYNGDVDKLTAFVKNPAKINPAYPPMPNQGLKPAEARAIAKYIMEEVKKY